MGSTLIYDRAYKVIYWYHLYRMGTIILLLLLGKHYRFNGSLKSLNYKYENKKNNNNFRIGYRCDQTDKKV